MKIKKFGAVPAALGLVCALALTGCSATEANGPAPTDESSAPAAEEGAIDLEKVTLFEEIEAYEEVQALLPDEIKKGSVTVALSAAAPPTTFVSQDGKTSLGLNADVARALVRIMGLDATLVSVPFEGIIPGLASGKYTLSMASMSPTAERLEVMDMVTFTKGGTSIALPVDNPKELTTSNLCGMRVAVGVGTIQATRQLPDLSAEMCESKDEPAIVAVEVPNPNQALLSLSSGRVDAFMGDGVPLAYAHRVNDGEFEILEENSLNADSENDSALKVTLGAMAVPKGSELTPALVKSMEILQALPQYKAIYERWGMENYALEADEVQQISSAK